MDSKRLFSIIFVVFIDLLGFSLILPLLPYYAETFKASEFTTGLLIASYAAMQLIGAPILGRLSDRIGRRPVLLVSVLGTFVGFVMLGFANALWILFASRILDGISGGNLSVAQAYISDVTDAKNRSKGLGMIGAAFGLGFIIGPAAGGFLSQWGFHVPALVAAGLSLINLALIFFWLPESLTQERRVEMSNQKRPEVSLSALQTALKRPFSGPILITRFFFGLAFAVFQTIFALYALAKFNLTATQTGYILTYVGVLSVFVQGFLVGQLTRSIREDVLITVSVALMGISLAGWALAPSVAWLLIILTPTAISGGLLNTLLSSTLTKAVTQQEIGGILGLSTSIESATRIIAPILGGALLQQIGTWAPGVFSAALMVGVTVYVWKSIFNNPVAVAMVDARIEAIPVKTDPKLNN
jgi:DHA1 family tetracycline resistance protein-like MFS transporter